MERNLIGDDSFRETTMSSWQQDAGSADLATSYRQPQSKEPQSMEPQHSQNTSNTTQQCTLETQCSTQVAGSSPVSVETKPEEPVTCGECLQRCANLQQYLDHQCTQTRVEDISMNSSDSDSLLSDVEAFEGRIVYQPDGSAYIIEPGDSECSESDASLDIPTQEGAIVDKRGVNVSTALPQIVNAFHVSWSTVMYDPSLYGPATSLYGAEKKRFLEQPVMHSYRVYDLRTSEGGTKETSDGKTQSIRECDYTSVPTKPILMCFICKLSFGYTKSFVSHATNEHKMTLKDSEQLIMNRTNSSAIIQGVGVEKQPLLSFLEPNGTSGGQCNIANGQSVVSLAAQSSAGYVYNTTTQNAEALSVMAASLSSNDRQGSNPEPGATGSDKVTSLFPQLPRDAGGGGQDSEEERNACSSSQNPSYSHPFGEYEKRLTSSPARALSRPGSQHSSSQSEAGSSHGDVMDMGMHGFSRSPLSPGNPFFCSHHPDGRTNGVECPKCDLILGSGRSLGGHITMMHSRNSCKTLKCPKCNWHYKYQETLEIHMKEKHPESETTCMYCLANQPHPRLARGETYTCGYKPYRCEICNYSTTTKGNLSIHMQSDKHLNNVNDAQNSGPGVPQSTSNSSHDLFGQTSAEQAPSSSQVRHQQQHHLQQKQQLSEQQQQLQHHHQQLIQQQQQLAQQQHLADINRSSTSHKGKPSWRCDICNYETNVARNLRIHMTSEKHTHNMLMLQQNMKHMQQDMQMQLSAVAALQDEQLRQIGAAFGLGGSDLAAAMAPAATGFNPFILPGTLNPQIAPNTNRNTIDGDQSMESTAHKPIDGNMKIYQCCICNVFSTENLEALHSHMQKDRTKTAELEVVMVVNGTYMCKLCQYKTNLKANFQLHCKTDKHLQKLQLINHIREGGPQNDWRLKYLNMTNPVQIRCNACDFQTNSIHKFQLHISSQVHDLNARLYLHLQASESNASSTRYYNCAICNFNTRSRANMMQHVKSVKHLRNEAIHQHQRGLVEDEISNILTVKEILDGDKVTFDDLDEKASTPDNAQAAVEGTVSSADALQEEKSMLKQALMEETTPAVSISSSSTEKLHICPYCNYSSGSELRLQAHVVAQHTQHQKEVQCPLCPEIQQERSKMESHLVKVHNVTPEGLQRLLLMVEQPDWSSPPSVPTTTSSSSSATSANTISSMKFKGDSKNDSITTNQEGTMADIEENPQEVEEYQCHMCLKSFMTLEDLFSHQNRHGHLKLQQTPRGLGYLCWKKGCNQYFKTPQALQTHFREIHAKRQIQTISERHVYKFRCSQCSLAFKTMDKLQLHSQYHMIRAATKCNICDRNFKSVSSLQKHIELSHPDVSALELEQYKSLLAASLYPRDAHSMSSIVEGEIKREFEEGEVVDSSVDVETSADTSAENFHKEIGLTSNEGQLLDDYLNTQAMAEENFDDPNRKFKCHRCRVAYTKHNYLLSHNKTLVHRKGERFSSPMEKYLDPNRPYKCDICKESFTQKSILLVHYNSVSHLHKLKKNAAESKLSPASPEEEKKYKCNICKVAYSQGSTLDIHIRSVLHQTRASKLQELALTGQVDLSQPLIEQPEIQKPGKEQEEQHRKMLEEMLLATAKKLEPQSPKGLPTSSSVQSTAATSSTMSNLMNSIISTPLAAPLGLQPGASQFAQPPFLFPSQALYTCPNCNSMFMTQEALLQHQKMFCFFSQQLHAASMLGAQPSTTPFESLTSKAEQTLTEEEHTLKQPAFIRRTKSALHKQLLEGYGFEIVMQFNEYYQRRNKKRKMEETDDDKPINPTVETEPGKSGLTNEEDSKTEPSTSTTDQKENFDTAQIEEDAKKNDEISSKDNVAYKEKTVNDFPEMNKCKCSKCGREFSSIWVLKAHEEERHKDVIPLNAVEKYSEKFKADWESKVYQQQIAEAAASSAEFVAAATSFESNSANTGSLAAHTIGGFDVNPFSSHMMNFRVNLGFPLNMNMSMLAAMNLHPPLIPVMMPPHIDAAQYQQAALAQLMPDIMQSQQSQHTTAASAAAMAAQAAQKRARTRISDEQLKILRAHFDINNSPSEDQILELSNTTSLPPKVIKHWFRNTLFKERQRNKDSPYNFNNPPTSVLHPDHDVKKEESDIVDVKQERSQVDRAVDPHEKIQYNDMIINDNVNQGKGETDTVEDKEKSRRHSTISNASSSISDNKTNHEHLKDINQEAENLRQPNTATSTGIHDEVRPTERSRPDSEIHKSEGFCISKPFMAESQILPNSQPLNSQKAEDHNTELPHNENKDGSSLRYYSTPYPPSSSLTPLSSWFSSPMSNPAFTSSPYPTPQYSQASMDSTTSNYSQPGTNPLSTSPSGNSYSHNSGAGYSYHESTPRRANRTRFTDYQIKVLHDYFEKNAYPKDDELDHLSKMLGLSPRVIVVWFQNARQKARKIYENQPPQEGDELRYQRTPGLNYQCKRCCLVFQRYYELIKHQKTVCYKEESGSRVGALDSMQSSCNSNSSQGSFTGQPLSLNMTVSPSNEKRPSEPSFDCDKCSLTFTRFDHWKEHQTVHMIDPSMMLQFSPNSAFGQLQNFDNRSFLKRKTESEEIDEGEQHGKRLRTTILPEQLDYLYQQYQRDSNPSRKQLEEISREVALRKRVVQVWFQNTRARERKGHFRCHQQAINKRCPFCRALFKARSALESHLATKHAEHVSRGDINIDNLPNAEPEPGDQPSSPCTSVSEKIVSPSTDNLSADPYLEGAMKRFYEDSLRRYLEHLSSPNTKQELPTESLVAARIHDKVVTKPPVSENHDEQHDLNDYPWKMHSAKESPEHLLKKAADNLTSSKDAKEPYGPIWKLNSGEMSEIQETEESRRKPTDLPWSQTDGDGLTMSWTATNETGEHQLDNTTPKSSTKEGENHSETCSETQSIDSDWYHGDQNPNSPNRHPANKRFRTQMSNLQVKVMKCLFADYKTPSMAECELVGKEIGLPKRVVQVWFQNARAKEKKNKLSLAKQTGQEGDIASLPPTKCQLCKATYTHKYTIQDHVFTKHHVANIISCIQQKEGEGGGSSSESALALAQLMRTYEISQNSASMTSHTQQLQSIAGLTVSTSFPVTSTTVADSTAVTAKLNGIQCDEKTFDETSKEPRPPVNQSAVTLSNPFSDIGLAGSMQPPPDNNMAAYFPYLFGAGMSGFSFPAAPFLHPAMLQGTGGLLAYDPLTYGTPLNMLQIPASALQDIGNKLAGGTAHTARFTQDGRSISDLRRVIPERDCDVTVHHETEVGFVCKKCHLVFPTEHLCNNHQMSVCFPGQAPNDRSNILTLVQSHYKCEVCNDTYSTQQEYEFHCKLESHVRNVQNGEMENKQSKLVKEYTPTSSLSHNLACSGNNPIPATNGLS